MIRAMDHAPTPETITAALLAMLRVMAERFAAAFGAPSALIKGGDIWGETRKRVLRWLHEMECVAKRLLLLRAAQFPPPESFGSPQPLHQHSHDDAHPSPLRPKKPSLEDLYGLPEDSADWNVRFVIAPPPGARWNCVARRRTQRGRAAAPSLQNLAYYADCPRPLAERFEALLRVLDDPDSYAERLALRLYRWRGRAGRRHDLLLSLCAKTSIANEAGLEDSAWDLFGKARAVACALAPMFSSPASNPMLPNSRVARLESG